MISKFSIISALCVATGLFLSSPALARKVKVSDVPSLRAAVENAQSGDTLLLKRGVYRLDSSIRIEGKSGIAIMPASPRHKVKITGSKKIRRSEFKRLKGVPRGVRVLDITALGVKGPTINGHGHPSVPAWSFLFAENRLFHLASWPEDGFLPIDSVLVTGISLRFDGSMMSRVAPSADMSLRTSATANAGIDPRGDSSHGPGFGTIRFREDRPLEWSDPTVGFVNGVFRYGWAEEIVPIKSVNPDKTLEVADTTMYGFEVKPGERFQKWRVLNIPEEVDKTMEYSIDEIGSRLVAALPGWTRSFEVSVLEEPLLVLDGCERVSVSSIEFFASRGDGVALSSCSDVGMHGCVFHGLGHKAVTIDAACRRCGLSSCTVFDVAAGGVILDGGDRKNIVRGDNFVSDCVLHDFNLVEKSSCPAVSMKGLGNRVSRCEIFNSATQAILMNGNDQVIEWCDIHHVCQDVEDCGAIYYGRNPSERGGIIRGNHFHDIDVPWNVRAVYHDDGACACLVEGNLFERISSPPVQIGGGSDIIYRNNVFRDLPCAAIKIDARLLTWGRDRYFDFPDKVALVDGPAFREHYPEFASYWEEDPCTPRRNVLEDNTFINVKWVFDKVVWSDHDYNDIIEGEANFFSSMHGNSISR